MTEDTTRRPYMQLEVIPDTATIAPGDTVGITPRLRFDNGGVADFGTFQPFNVALVEGDTLGNLIENIASGGGPESGTSDQLQFARPGFGFIADTLAPSLSQVHIGVATEVFLPNATPTEAPSVAANTGSAGVPDFPSFGGVPVSGTGQVVIREDSLALFIEIPDPKEVWPTIPRDGARVEFDFEQVENTIEEILVDVIMNNEPLKDKPVTITAEWVQGEGGHTHRGGNDLLSPPSELMGWIVNIVEQDSSRGELDAMTDELGQIRLRYRATEFGGKIVLKAATLNQEGDSLFARDTLLVEVPDLVRLADGTNYEKVGGTRSHHGPRLDTQNADFLTPDNNHFGTQEFVDSLEVIADEWEEIVTADSMQDNRQIPLNINDMSLPNGGKFDIFGNFSAIAEDHAFHRVGRDVDIRTTRSFPITPSARNGVLLKETVVNSVNFGYRNLKFEEVCEDNGANPTPEIHGSGVTEHYHVYFYPEN